MNINKLLYRVIVSVSIAWAVVTLLFISYMWISELFINDAGPVIIYKYENGIVTDLVNQKIETDNLTMVTVTSDESRLKYTTAFHSPNIKIGSAVRRVRIRLIYLTECKSLSCKCL